MDPGYPAPPYPYPGGAFPTVRYDHAYMDDPPRAPRYADIDAPVKIPMRGWDMGLVFVVFVLAALIGCFYVTVSNVDRDSRLHSGKPIPQREDAPARGGAPR
jgi:hypothetical protein